MFNTILTFQSSPSHHLQIVRFKRVRNLPLRKVSEISRLALNRFSGNKMSQVELKAQMEKPAVRECLTLVVYKALIHRIWSSQQTCEASSAGIISPSLQMRKLTKSSGMRMALVSIRAWPKSSDFEPSAFCITPHCRLRKDTWQINVSTYLRDTSQ